MPTFERATLSNGIRVLMAPVPTAQSVTCVVMFAAGSRYETPQTNGIPPRTSRSIGSTTPVNSIPTNTGTMST